MTLGSSRFRPGLASGGLCGFLALLVGCFDPDQAVVPLETLDGGFADVGGTDAGDDAVPGDEDGEALSTSGGDSMDGNGTDGDEADGGTSTSTDGPSPSGSAAECGNGIVEDGESCDEGNENGPRKPCLANCLINVCGDGDVGPGESCDDGNSSPGDGCNQRCVSETCGDGVEQNDEQCDDGNLVSGDGCSDACIVEGCGTGFVDAGEVCDDGLRNGDYGFCGADCTALAPRCGDGQVDRGFEDCEPATETSPALQEIVECVAVPGESFYGGAVRCSDTCQYDLSACLTAECGDGVVEGPERCDEGVLPFTRCDQLPGQEMDQGTLSCDLSTCAYDTSMCETIFCGNGVREAGETCDQVEALSCSSLGRGFDRGSAPCVECEIVTTNCADCGNGVVEPGEACDDGDFPNDPTRGNGTYGNCALDCSGPGPRCGDGTVQTAFQENCEPPSSVLASVECEDVPGQSFTDGTLRCDGACRFDVDQCTRCGDGVVEAPEVCDDGPGGNTGGYGFCNTDCRARGPRCGDGIVQPNEGCDDGSARCENCQLLECLVAQDCPDDGLVCNGTPTCVNNRCQGGGPLQCGNGGDNDCEGFCVEPGSCQIRGRDQDGDGQRSAACGVAPGPDCLDSGPSAVARTVGQGFEELCDGIDNDCDGFVDLDDTNASLGLGGQTRAVPGVEELDLAFAGGSFYGLGYPDGSQNLVFGRVPTSGTISLDTAIPPPEGRTLGFPPNLAAGERRGGVQVLAATAGGGGQGGAFSYIFQLATDGTPGSVSQRISGAPAPALAFDPDGDAWLAAYNLVLANGVVLSSLGVGAAVPSERTRLPNPSTVVFGMAYRNGRGLIVERRGQQDDVRTIPVIRNNAGQFTLGTPRLEVAGGNPRPAITTHGNGFALAVAVESGFRYSEIDQDLNTVCELDVVGPATNTAPRTASERVAIAETSSGIVVLHVAATTVTARLGEVTLYRLGNNCELRDEIVVNPAATQALEPSVAVGGGRLALAWGEFSGGSFVRIVDEELLCR